MTSLAPSQGLGGGIPTDDVTLDANWTMIMTTITTAKARVSPGDFLAFKVGDKLNVISVILLAIVGTIGNALSLVVLFNKGMRMTTSSVYLRAIAVADTLVLWPYLVVMIAHVYVKGMAGTAFCKVMLWFESSFQQISSYLVIVMTAERFFAVTFPLNVARIFTHKVAWTAVVIIYLAFLTINIPYLIFIMSYKDVICFYDYNYSSLIVTWSKVDSTIAAYIPAIAILLLNILIIRQVVIAKRGVKHLTGNESQNKGQAQHKAGGDQAAQITRMLLSVSITYWVLILPMSIFYAGAEHWFDLYVPKQYANRYLTQQVCIALLLTNNSCNFFLYCLTGNKFRQVLKSILPCFKTPDTLAYSGNTSMASLSKISVSTVSRPAHQ